MDFDRHCAEIVAQTALLATDLADADLRAPVPSCPGWTLGMLVRHIGGGQRWAEEVVRTRATDFLPDDAVRRLDGDDSGPLPGGWLVEGAERFAATLRAAGPDAPVWAAFHYGTASFWARRFTHETVIHRADAALAAGAPFAADPEVVVDAVDEWVELDVIPMHFELAPGKREVLGEGRTLSFVATDVGERWFLDATGEAITWSRSGGDAAVTVRAPLTELLLALYRRRGVGGDVEVRGDADLLELYLRHAAFA